MIKRIVKGIFVLLCFAVMLVFLAVAVFFAAKLLLDLKGGSNVSVMDNDSVTDASGESDSRLNVLVMGKDNTSGLCDMIMLVSYDTSSNSACVLQIPRDTYASYTESSYKKINGAVNALGGEKEFCDFLSEALCVKIDKYVTVNLDAVGEVVDIIGGVEVDIPFDMNYKDPSQGLSINLKKGKTVLDGEGAQQFVRYRSGYAEGDLGRMDAQKIFLAALVSKLKSAGSLLRVNEIFTAVSDDIKTDISMTDIVLLAADALCISSDKVTFVTLAGQSAVASISGASYYVVSRSAAIRIVNELLGGNADEESFDRNRVFLNDRYESFSNIYYSDIEYKAYDAGSLLLGGIDIAHK